MRKVSQEPSPAVRTRRNTSTSATEWKVLEGHSKILDRIYKLWWRRHNSSWSIYRDLTLLVFRRSIWSSWFSYRKNNSRSKNSSKKSL